MRPVKFRAAAAADMRRIAREAQAANYAANLRDDIKSLHEFALRYPEFEGGHHGLRRMNSRCHAVFYLVSQELIEIVRVLHAAMDFDERFG